MTLLAQLYFGYLPTFSFEFADESYTTLYKKDEYPVVKYLAVPLYFEVQLLHNEDPQIELFLQSCWATASPGRDSIPQWPIIVQR